MTLLLDIKEANKKLNFISKSIAGLKEDLKRIAIELLKIWDLSVELTDKAEAEGIGHPSDIFDSELIKSYLMRYEREDDDQLKFYIKLIDSGILTDLHKRLAENGELGSLRIILNYIRDLIEDKELEAMLLFQEKKGFRISDDRNIFKGIIEELMGMFNKPEEALKDLVDWLLIETL